MVTPVQIEALLPYPCFVHYFHIRKNHGPAWIVNSIRFHLLNRVYMRPYLCLYICAGGLLFILHLVFCL